MTVAETYAELLLAVVPESPADIEKQCAIVSVPETGKDIHIPALKMLGEFRAERKLTVGVHLGHRGDHFASGWCAGWCGRSSLETEGGRHGNRDGTLGEFHAARFVSIQ
jgi:hypothetical protein